MTPSRIALAVAAGLFLASFPLLRYWHFGAAHAPHADHEAWFGGQLGMVGDHHIEVVRRMGKVEVYVSDARRQPLQATAAWAVFDDKVRRPLRWESPGFVGEDEPQADRVEAVVDLADGSHLALSFDFGEP